METRYTNSIEDNMATMLLYGEIGYDINAEYFTHEMKYHNSLGRKLKVYINSPGGSVFDGFAIAQAIIDYDADTHVVGLAASMAGVILQFGKNRTANDFAVGMIHLPSAKGKSNDKLLDIVKESLLSVLEGRCKKPRNEIENMMAEETFMDASEMMDLGFIDEIVTTNVAADTVQAYLGSFTSAGELYKIYNNLIQTTEMDKLKTHFKLENNATEETILNSIGGLETQIENLNEELSVANTEKDKALQEVTKLSEERDELISEIANYFVDNAIADGKIAKDKKDIWLEAAKKDPKGVKAQLDTIAVGNRLDSVSASIIKKGDQKVDDPEENIVDWVRNNGEELERLRIEDPEELDRVMDKYGEALKISK